MTFDDAVVGLLGIESGLVSGVINLESSGVEPVGRDHAIMSNTTKPHCLQLAADIAGNHFDNWFDPLARPRQHHVHSLPLSASTRCLKHPFHVRQIDAKLTRDKQGREAIIRYFPH